MRIGARAERGDGAIAGRQVPAFATLAQGGLAGRSRVPARGRIVASACLVFGSVAAFVSIYAHAAQHVPVLVIVRPVHAGAVIQASDLGTYELSSVGSLPVISAGSESSVVGSTATVSIEPGTLLTGADYARSQPLPAGTAIVGVAPKIGQLPATGVVAGQHVMVVGTGASCASGQSGALLSGTSGGPAIGDPGVQSSGGSGGGNGAVSPSGGSSVLVPEAEVYAIAQPPQNNSGAASSLVSLAVPQVMASAVAVCAAADDVSVVVLPQGTAR